jgi:hypothetical protein
MTEVNYKGQLSSSTSALPSARTAVKPHYPHKHARSASSSSSNSHSGHKKEITTIKPTRPMPFKVSDLGMPPPQYLPVRPSQSSNTVLPVSRSTSSVDARKRVVSSSVCSRTDLPGSAQPGFLVRPASASGLHNSDIMRGPHCSSTLSNSSDQRSANGPQRIPLPDVNRSNRGIGIAVSSHTHSRINPDRIQRVPERSKPMPQSRGNNSAAVMTLPSGRPLRSASQPTLSQLSRAHAIERKLPTTKAVKPLWGQSGRGKPKSLMKSTTTTHEISKTRNETRSITPCQVPLPPSPLRPGTPHNRERSNPTTPHSIHHSLSDALFSVPQDTVENNTKSLPRTAYTEETSVQETTVIDAKNTNPGDADNGRKCTLPLDPLSGEAPLNSQTPKQLFSPQDHIDISTTKTPISALLTTIERGFLLTPSSPLSPPQPYLYRGPISSGERDVSTHTACMDHSEQKLFPRKAFVFGVTGGDAGRHALNNLNIH